MATSREIAFEKGKVAFKKGNLSNPYRPTTYEYREWERGFNVAYFKNQGDVAKTELCETPEFKNFIKDIKSGKYESLR